jgi:hypothetical protein
MKVNHENTKILILTDGKRQWINNSELIPFECLEIGEPYITKFFPEKPTIYVKIGELSARNLETGEVSTGEADKNYYVRKVNILEATIS